jgi:hypothetical protein
LKPSKSALIASKPTSKRRTGGPEQYYIEELMAMDSDGRDEVEDEANEVLKALRKARSLLRKLERVKEERAKIEGSSADNSSDGA